MIDIQMFSELFLIALVCVMVPGPTVMLVIEKTLNNGKKSGFFVALGGVLGVLIWILLAIVGIKAIMHSSSAKTYLDILVGLFFIYTGYKSFKNRNKESEVVDKKSFVKQMSVGAVCNILHFGLGMFYIGLFSQILEKHSGDFGSVAIYILTFLTIEVFWNACFIVLAASVMKKFLRQYSSYLAVVFSVLITFIGVKILLSEVLSIFYA